jgi:hypothetical protein
MVPIIMSVVIHKCFMIVLLRVHLWNQHYVFVYVIPRSFIYKKQYVDVQVVVLCITIDRMITSVIYHVRNQLIVKSKQRIHVVVQEPIQLMSKNNFIVDMDIYLLIKLYFHHVNYGQDSIFTRHIQLNLMK